MLPEPDTVTASPDPGPVPDGPSAAPHQFDSNAIAAVPPCAKPVPLAAKQLPRESGSSVPALPASISMPVVFDSMRL